MPSNPTPSSQRAEQLLLRLGRRLRRARRDADLTQRELATRSGLSPRFLTQLERGESNISVARLVALCGALELELSTVFADAERSLGGVGAPRKVALLGMRGAGKSTVGRAIASRLAIPFVELDGEVERAAGVTLAELFELSDSSYHRRLEREALEAVLERPERLVLATGGSLVTERETYATLRSRALTVWLQASPEEHWNRVVAQGDTRPMADRPDAMEELRVLLAERAPLYRQADLVVETGGRSADAVAEGLAVELGAP